MTSGLSHFFAFGLVAQCNFAQWHNLPVRADDRMIAEGPSIARH
jgi:hypothetical protein